MEMTPRYIREQELSRGDHPRYEFRAKCLLKLGESGRNFKYYHPTVQLTGIDLSEQMLFRAERRSKTAACRIDLHKENR